MKVSISFFVVAALLLTILPSGFGQQQQQLELPRPSQKATVSQRIGLTDVSIAYSRPGVKGRTIWGGLVPYDKVWRTGANEATAITFSDDVKINGQALAAGTYSFHTIPSKDEWTIIFNKVADQWGSYDYNPSQDALRIKVKPQEGVHQEWLQFSFPEVLTASATVELAWEKLRVPFKIETNTIEKAMANIRKAVVGATEWRIPYRAADFVLTSNAGNKEEAIKWLDQSIALKETYWNLRLKASVLADQGEKKEAIALAEKAVKIGRESKEEPGEIEKTEKLIAEWKAES